MQKNKMKAFSIISITILSIMIIFLLLSIILVIFDFFEDYVISINNLTANDKIFDTYRVSWFHLIVSIFPLIMIVILVTFSILFGKSNANEEEKIEKFNPKLFIGLLVVLMVVQAMDIFYLVHLNNYNPIYDGNYMWVLFIVSLIIHLLITTSILVIFIKNNYKIKKQ